MLEDLGIVCGDCDTLNPMDARFCPVCGHDLQLFPTSEPSSPHESRKDVRVEDAQEKPMEQARYYVCKECSSPVPTGHKFCGACGATVPKEILEPEVQYFGDMQMPGQARLMLIRGSGDAEGLTYFLQGDHAIVGNGAAAEVQIPFTEDPWVSPQHAKFFYRSTKLFVSDEGSVNGVYMRVNEKTSIEPGDYFLCGEQVFRLDATPPDTSGPGPDQTFFYSSPKPPSPFRLTQILEGGGEGMVYCARENSVDIGREACEMNFSNDLFMSSSHAQVSMQPDGTFTIEDHDSRNGTFVRIGSEKELSNGDYLFIGHQLLRVEMTS